MRNPYFQPSGFEPQEIVNIIEGAREAKGRLDKIKGRKRKERKQVNNIRAGNVLKAGIHFKQQGKSKTDQIQYGFDLAKWWGELHG